MSCGFWRWPDLGTEESVSSGWDSDSSIAVVINIVEKFGNTIFFLRSEFSGQSHIGS